MASPDFGITWTPSAVELGTVIGLAAKFGNAPNNLPGITSLNIRHTANVEQYLFGGCPDLLSVAFPNLISTIEINLVNCPSLTSFSAPLLQSINNLDLTGNAVLNTIDLSALIHWPIGDITLTGCITLQTILMNSLQDVNSLNFDTLGINSLVTVDLTALTTVTIDLVSSVSAIASLTMPNIVSVGGSFILEGTQLTDFIFSNLASVGGALGFSNNTSAINIDLTLLNTVGGTFSLNGSTFTGALDCSNLLAVGGNIEIVNSPNFTAFNFSQLNSAGDSIYLHGNFGVTTINLSQLNSLTSGSGTLSFRNNASLLTVDISALTDVVQINGYGCASLTGIGIGSLTNVIGGFDMNNCPLLTNPDFTNLVQVNGGNLDFNGCTSLTNLNFQALSQVGGDCNFNNCTSLSSISFQSNIDFGAGGGTTVDFSACPAMTSFDFGGTAHGVNISTWNWSGNALDETSVDNILVTLKNASDLSLIFTGALIDVSGGTNSAPSGTGVAAAAALITYGCTVLTN